MHTHKGNKVLLAFRADDFALVSASLLLFLPLRLLAYRNVQ
jgi:hypothetical protein